MVGGDLANEQAMLSPVKYRRVLLIRRNSSFGRVTRFVRAIVIRAINVRLKLRIDGRCVVARADRLLRSIMRGSVTRRVRNVTLGRLSVPVDVRKVNDFVRTHAVTVRRRAVIARLRVARRGLNSKVAMLIRQGTIYVRRGSLALQLLA